MLVPALAFALLHSPLAPPSAPAEAAEPPPSEPATDAAPAVPVEDPTGEDDEAAPAAAAEQDDGAEAPPTPAPATPDGARTAGEAPEDGTPGTAADAPTSSADPAETADPGGLEPSAPPPASEPPPTRDALDDVDPAGELDAGPASATLAAGAGALVGLVGAGAVGLLGVPATIVAFPLVVIGLVNLVVPGVLAIAIFLGGGALVATLVGLLTYPLQRLAGIDKRTALGAEVGTGLGAVGALAVFAPVGAALGLLAGIQLLSSMNLTNVQGLPVDGNAAWLMFGVSAAILAGCLVPTVALAGTAGGAAGGLVATLTRSDDEDAVLDE